MDGPTGLDYASCRAVAEDEGFEWDEVFPFLRALEQEWLKRLEERRTKLRAEAERERTGRRR